jgi:hypothetical protein
VINILEPVSATSLFWSQPVPEREKPMFKSQSFQVDPPAVYRGARSRLHAAGAPFRRILHMENRTHG